METVIFGGPRGRLYTTPGDQQQHCPTTYNGDRTELALRSPAWTLVPARNSAIYTFDPSPPQIVNPFAPEPLYVPVASATARMPQDLSFERFSAHSNNNTYARPDHNVPPRPVYIPPQAPTMQQNLSPERNVMGYRELIRGITSDVEKICCEYVLINVSTTTAGPQADRAFLDLVIAHMGSREAAAYILKRSDLHVALVTGLVWRQVSTYILSVPVLDKAPSWSAPAFRDAWIDETIAHTYDADNLALRQMLVERRASFVPDIQRAPEYQAFVKTFATQVANDVIRDLMPVWRIGFTYKITQVLVEKITTRLVRLISRMRAEAKVFHFDFYGSGMQFTSATMSKRNPDLLLQHGNDGTYAVTCGIAPTVFEIELSRNQLITTPIFLAEVLVHDQSKDIDEALAEVKLYGPMPVPPPVGGRRRSRRKTGAAPPFQNRRDSTTM